LEKIQPHSLLMNWLPRVDSHLEMTYFSLGTSASLPLTGCHAGDSWTAEVSYPSFDRDLTLPSPPGIRRRGHEMKTGPRTGLENKHSSPDIIGIDRINASFRIGRRTIE
jgi:hypothetical protein